MVLFCCSPLSCNRSYALLLGLKQVPVTSSGCTVPVVGKERHILPCPENPSQIFDLGLELFSETYNDQICDLSLSAGSCWGFIFNIAQCPRAESFSTAVGCGAEAVWEGLALGGAGAAGFRAPSIASMALAPQEGH